MQTVALAYLSPQLRIRRLTRIPADASANCAEFLGRSRVSLALCQSLEQSLYLHPPPLGSPRFARGTKPRARSVPPAGRGNLKELIRVHRFGQARLFALTPFVPLSRGAGEGERAAPLSHAVGEGLGVRAKKARLFPVQRTQVLYPYQGARPNSNLAWGIF